MLREYEKEYSMDINDTYTMAKPCAGCPFGYHKNAVLHLGEEKIRKICEATSFRCHQTTKETGDGSERECAGFMIYQMANEGPTQMMRIAGRIGMMTEEKYDELKLAGEGGSSVVDLDELIERHT